MNPDRPICNEWFILCAGRKSLQYSSEIAGFYLSARRKVGGLIPTSRAQKPKVELKIVLLPHIVLLFAGYAQLFTRHQSAKPISFKDEHVYEIVILRTADWRVSQIFKSSMKLILGCFCIPCHLNACTKRASAILSHIFSTDSNFRCVCSTALAKHFY